MVLQVHRTQKEPIVTWEALPADYILPDDPVENIQQSSLAAALTDALGTAGRIQPQMLIGSSRKKNDIEEAANQNAKTA